jgi:hypothetical protein
VKQHKHDRRSQRTRRLADAAMMELLLEKRYALITVQDLLDRSAGSRRDRAFHFLYTLL